MNLKSMHKDVPMIRRMAYRVKVGMIIPQTEMKNACNYHISESG